MTEPARIGLLRLADAAPVIVAAEWGTFARHGLSATLSIEPSWANIADKLTYGLLDAAVILPPLAIAASLGLRGPRADLIVPMGLSQGGNTVTLSHAAWRAVVLEGDLTDRDDVMMRGRALGAWVTTMRDRGTRPRLGIVHLFSGHNLLLRYWLSACGVDPDHDLDLVVIPPAEMVTALGDGRIDGFCAGAPWGTLAAEHGVGHVVARGSDIWNRHPEKALAVRRGWAEEDPDRLQGIIRALVDATRLCDDPDAADDLAYLLAEPRHVGVPAAAIRPSLAMASRRKEIGGDDPGREHVVADRIGFLDNTATMPWTSQAAWFASQMQRWGWLQAADLPAAAALYRPDLYRAALAGTQLALPDADSKHEGAHDQAWTIQAGAETIPMLPDRFCDGMVFTDPDSA